ncbi:MAG: cardiolipin synthase [Lachnospiraceae bacterium]|nr:cardiolipin synthase [Lachnospiraceae bacterium]
MNWAETWEIAKIVWRYVLMTLVVFDIIFALIAVFFERKNPKSVWAWILLMMAVPYVGFVLYLLAGTTLNKRRMFRDKGFEDMMKNRIHEQKKELERLSGDRELPKELYDFKNLVYYNLHNSYAVLSDGNDIDVFTSGQDKFAALKEDLKKAEKFIDFQYYIIRNDELFEEIVKILKEKVDQGVEVRVLYDGLGARSTPKRYWKKLKAMGIRVGGFWPAWFGKINFRVNYRDHRKIVVIDNKVAYVGGFNIGREYIDMEEKFGHWRDTHLRITGDAAYMLHGRFALDWAYVTGEKLFDREDMGIAKRENPSRDNCYIQIVSSGPDSDWQQIRDNYLYLISHAKQSLYIQSPYFIPDDCILAALKLAAQSGIDVRIMIPCKPDHPFVYWATHCFAGELVEAGATCYKYEGGFLHAKGVIADDEVYTYGTANMDIRSFALDFEVNAVIYDKDKAHEMTEIFLKDVEECSVMTKEEYKKRKFIIRFKEQISRLLAPVL